MVTKPASCTGTDVQNDCMWFYSYTHTHTNLTTYRMSLLSAYVHVSVLHGNPAVVTEAAKQS